MPIDRGGWSEYRRRHPSLSEEERRSEVSALLGARRAPRRDPGRMPPTATGAVEHCEPGTCTACGAPVRWAQTAKGRPVALDAEPHPEGAWRVVRRDGRPPLAYPLTRQDRELLRLAGRDGGVTVGFFQVHLATCPSPESHSDRRLQHVLRGL